MDSITYDYKEKKIVAVLSSEISVQVAMNVIGHLSISIGAFAEKSLMGRMHLVDKSGIKHLGISKYPFIITRTNPKKLQKVIIEARTYDNILFSDFPNQMLITEHDDELATTLKNANESDLEYLGAVFYGPSEDINRITSKFSLWK